jgi:hypothetical protein
MRKTNGEARKIKITKKRIAYKIMKIKGKKRWTGAGRGWKRSEGRGKDKRIR